MGIDLSRLWSVFRPRINLRVLLLGLDTAGKTTILYKLKLGELVAAIPTIGINVETVSYKKVNFTVWDMGANAFKIPTRRQNYFINTQGVLFTVDSADHERLDEARQEIQGILADPLLSGVPVLVWANKSDMPQALSVAQVADGLKLHEFRDRKCYVQASSAISGQGLYEGLDWLTTAITDLRLGR